MVTLQGTGVSTGIAAGSLCFYRRAPVAAVQRPTASPADELARWKQAAHAAAVQLNALCAKARAEAGETAAQLFESHQLMLEDPDYKEEIETAILQAKQSAEAAVHSAGHKFAALFEAMDDVYLRARSADVLDVSARVVRALKGEQAPQLTGTQPVLVAADDLSPSETIQMDKSRVLGFVLQNGSATSHTAILARLLGVPAVVGVGEVLWTAKDGQFAVLDGDTGAVVVEPDAPTRAAYVQKQRAECCERGALAALKGLPDVTQDGRAVKLYANISGPQDVKAVQDSDAQGIGLFRSEFLYLQGSDYPGEAEQFEAYRAVLVQMNPKPVTIRTMDIGADKQVEYFQLEHEENPALGMRALRICLERPDMFQTQLRALYRASAYGKLAILLPMVANVWEVQQTKRLCREVQAALKAEGVPFDADVPLGVMMETPAAVMIAPELAKEVQFFSLGTNDLTQYTLALDRSGVPALSRFYDAHHPAVLRMIRMTVDAAHAAGICVGICGELAADVSLTRELLAMGVDELSVSPGAVLELRQVIRNLSLGAE